MSDAYLAISGEDKSPAAQAIAPPVVSAPAPAQQPEPTQPPQPLKSQYLDAAMKDMNLNDQEQYLYQTHLRNLAAGGVPNKGGTSTLFAATFDVGGRAYVIPTVWGGKILMPDQAFQMAKQLGLDKFPSYDSEDIAEQRYNKMHEFMEQDLTGAGH